MPRRARHLIPTQLPRRGEVMAACAVFAVLGHLLFAQVTLILAVAFAAISRTTRWRSWWLAVPAAAGLAWTLAIGPRAAVAGFAAGPAQVLGYLGGGHPVRLLLQPHGAFAGASTWLPRQLPLALIAAAAECALARWLAWVQTDEWAVRPRRPGALAAVRTVVNSRAIRAGALLTRNGCALGVAPDTGARVLLSWPEVAGGVVVAGAVPDVLTMTSFQIVHAALRRRKPVIAVDMTGDATIARALTAGCAATGTPLKVFGTADGCYEPFRRASPARRLAMTLTLLGVTDPDEAPAQAVHAYLQAVCELIDAVPADPRTPVLDDIVHLLNPLALQARFQLVPAASPRRSQLADLIPGSMRTAQACPQVLRAAASHLAAVRRSPAGRSLRPARDPASGGIDLARAVRERSAVLFSVDAPDLARVICADITAVGDDLRRIGADGDGLVWLSGCGPLPGQSLAGLVTGGAAAGLPVLITTTSPAAADLAALANVLIAHRLGDAVTAASLAARTGTRMEPAAGAAELVPRPAVPPQTLLSLTPRQFVLAAREPAHRPGQLGLAVSARVPRGGRQ
jgi:hypothetical protein